MNDHNFDEITSTCGPTDQVVKSLLGDYIRFRKIRKLLRRIFRKWNLTTPWPVTIVLIAILVALVAGSGATVWIRNRHSNSDDLYAMSVAFKRSPTGEEIFETTSTPSHYRHVNTDDGWGCSFTSDGCYLRPPKPTKSNPARFVNKVKIAESLDLLFSLRFVDVVPGGHFQLAIGEGSVSGVTIQISKDKTKGIIYVSACQDGLDLPEAALKAPPIPSAVSKPYVSPVYPSAEEFWVLVHVSDKSLTVTIPIQGKETHLIFQLVADPELGERTIIERRSYGSQVLLRHLIIGDLSTLYTIVNGTFHKDDWPSFSIN